MPVSYTHLDVYKRQKKVLEGFLSAIEMVTLNLPFLVCSERMPKRKGALFNWCMIATLIGGFLMKKSFKICSACALLYTSSWSTMISSIDDEKFLAISLEFPNLKFAANWSTISACSALFGEKCTNKNRNASNGFNMCII